MAIAMSEQGARAGTASAIMGSMQFGCGLLCGVILNFLLWSVLLNMAIVMAIFVALALYYVFKLEHEKAYKLKSWLYKKETHFSLFFIFKWML